ncbi:MAG: DUF874 family protein [Rhodospirillales bacterium]|nr:DUF874 family protein [Rhodospirillales bacterium]
MPTKLLTAVFLGLALIVTAACSGSSQKKATADAEARAETAQEELETTREELETAQEELETTQEELETAQEELETAQEELETAQEDLETAQEDLETAQGAQQTAEEQREQLQRQLTEAEQAELNARAEQYIAAINDGGMSRGVTVSYERGSSLKINPVGNFKAGSGAPSISGFSSHTYTRQVGSEQTIYLYTNIQAPGTRAFWKIHGLTFDNASNSADHNPTPTAAATYITDPTDNTQATGVRVSGRFDGVSGTFTCDASGTCTGAKTGLDLTGLVGAPVNGERSFAAGTWTFTPNNISSGVQQMEDTEHLFFGIWAEEPELASQAHDYEYIVGGSTPFADFGELSGTATFRGGAIGKYVTRNQVGENAKIGTFTGTAEFTATFGASPTLEGNITDLRDGSQGLTGWSVYLGGANNDPAVFTDGMIADSPATASIGGVSATGTWDATLYGTNNPGRKELAADPDAATKYPLARFPQADLAGIVGNFHATSDATAADADAALAGAFAVTPR